MVKNLPAQAEAAVSIPGLGRSPEEENGSPLQYYCLGNTMGRGAWWATVHKITKRHDLATKQSGAFMKISVVACRALCYLQMCLVLSNVQVILVEKNRMIFLKCRVQAFCCI